MSAMALLTAVPVRTESSNEYCAPGCNVDGERTSLGLREPVGLTFLSVRLRVFEDSRHWNAALHPASDGVMSASRDGTSDAQAWAGPAVATAVAVMVSFCVLLTPFSACMMIDDSKADGCCTELMMTLGAPAADVTSTRQKAEAERESSAPTTSKRSRASNGSR